MVAYALLATSLQRIVCEIESGIRDFSHIFLDDALVLRGRRNETGVEDRAVAIEIVTVVEYAARRFTAGVAHSGMRLGRDKGPCWRLVGGDQTQRLITRIDDLERANEDAAEWIAADRLEPDFVGKRANVD